MSRPAVFEVDPRALAPAEMAAYIRWCLSRRDGCEPRTSPIPSNHAPSDRRADVEAAS